MSTEMSSSTTAETGINKSPFPGMDPYLEGEWWSEFHQTLAAQIRAQLMVLLPSSYVALLERYYPVDYSGLSLTQRGVNPDVHILVKEAVASYTLASPQVAGAITPPSLELISPIPQRVPALRVGIRKMPERQLVTIIEILSPANKHGQGYQKYLRKRYALLKTDTHLLELDLLRAGERIPLVGGELPPAPYYVFLSRFTRRPRTEVWPIQLRDSLPTVPVPLLPPDPDVPLALQTAINACFELVRYHERVLDYHQPPPPPPFSSTDLAWVESMVTTMS
ncbi:MAG: DUF4058 family protein [Anaerolineae bacterium]